MASTFGKNEIIDLIQDSIDTRGGLSPTIVNDIKVIVDDNVKMGTADEYAKSVSEDVDRLKRLLEDVLDGVATKTQNEDISNNKLIEYIGQSEQIYDDFVDDVKKTNKASAFLNSEIMRDIFGEIKSTFGGYVNDIFAVEKAAIIDPAMDMMKMTGRIMGYFKSPEEEALDVAHGSYDIAKDSRAILDSMYEQQSSLGYDSVSVSKDTNKILLGMDDVLTNSYDSVSVSEDTNKILLGMDDVLTNSYDSNQDILSMSKDTNDLLMGVNDNLTDGYNITEDVLETLDDALELDKQESLRLQRLAKEENKPGMIARFLKMIGDSIVLGLVAGAFIRTITLPFEILYKAVLKVSNLIGGIIKSTSLYTRLFASSASEAGIISQHMSSVSKFFKMIGGVLDEYLKIGKVFKAIAGFIESVKTIGFAPSLAILFKNLYKVTGLAKFISSIFDDFFYIVTGFKKTSDVAMQTSSALGKIIGTTTKVMDKISNIFKGVFKAANTFSVFFRSFIVGFARLGPWMAGIMAIIDFFTGFAKSTEETFIGKVKDGLVSAIMGFIELPLKILGWLWDWTLGLIGIESKGTGDKLVKWFTGAIKRYMDTAQSIIEGIISVISNVIKVILLPFKALYQIVTGDFSGLIETIKNWGKSIFGIFTGVFGIITDLLMHPLSIIGDLISPMVEWLGKKVEDTMAWFGTTFSNIINALVKGLVDIIFSPFNLISSIVSSIWNKIEKMAEGTIFEPLVNFLNMIGDFIGGVIGWFKDKAKSIPLIGNVFKDESDKIEDANNEDREKIAESTTRISEIQQRRADIESGKETFWGATENQRNIRKQNALADLEKDEIEEREKIAKKEAEIQSRSKKPIEAIESPVNIEAPTRDSVFDGVSHTYVNNLDPTPKPSEPSMIDDVKLKVRDLNVTPTPKPSEPSMIDDVKLKVRDLFSDYDDETLDYSEQPIDNIMASTAYDVDSSKQTFSKKQLDQSYKMEKTISSAMKEINNNMNVERPIVVQTGGDDRNQYDPKEDVEAMSILWLNKSWGLG